MKRLTVLQAGDGTYYVYDLNRCRVCYGRYGYKTEVEAEQGLKYVQECAIEVAESIRSSRGYDLSGLD